MSKKVKEFLKGKPELKEMYNAFADALNKKKVLLSSVDISIGESSLNKKEALGFDIETDRGFTDAEAHDIFSEFIKRFPHASIHFNMREDESALESALKRMSNAVIVVEGGFKLQKV